MEKGGRGGQRVACACVSEQFSKPERVCERGRRGMIAHTPSLFCFPPTDTPAEIGHPWPTCLLLLTPAHTALSFFLTDQMVPSPCIHAHASCFLSEKQSQCAALSEFRALQMQTRDFAYSFACLYQITQLKSGCLFIHSSEFFGFYQSKIIVAVGTIMGGGGVIALQVF